MPCVVLKNTRPAESRIVLMISAGSLAVCTARPVLESTRTTAPENVPAHRKPSRSMTIEPTWPKLHRLPEDNGPDKPLRGSTHAGPLLVPTKTRSWRKGTIDEPEADGSPC